MDRVSVPFLFVNPKSYYYGKKCVDFAKEVDRICGETGLQMFFTCPYADIREVAKNTSHVIVTAQSMESLDPGRGMGAVLGESLKEAGAGAVVLNHAEKTLTVTELYKSIVKAHKLGMLVIACADSVTEAKAVSVLGPDIVLAEPTDLIGTGTTADDSYTINCVKEIKSVAPDVKVMIASGITTPEDCYKVIYLGGDGTGSTSGIVKAEDPVKRVEDMAAAILQAMKDRN